MLTALRSDVVARLNDWASQSERMQTFDLEMVREACSTLLTMVECATQLLSPDADGDADAEADAEGEAHRLKVLGWMRHVETYLMSFVESTWLSGTCGRLEVGPEFIDWIIAMVEADPQRNDMDRLAALIIHSHVVGWELPWGSSSERIRKLAILYRMRMRRIAEVDGRAEAEEQRLRLLRAERERELELQLELELQRERSIMMNEDDQILERTLDALTAAAEGGGGAAAEGGGAAAEGGGDDAVMFFAAGHHPWFETAETLRPPCPPSLDDVRLDLSSQWSRHHSEPERKTPMKRVRCRSPGAGASSPRDHFLSSPVSRTSSSSPVWSGPVSFESPPARASLPRKSQSSSPASQLSKSSSPASVPRCLWPEPRVITIVFPPR